MNRCADGRRPMLCGGGAVHAIDPYALMVSCTWEGAPNSDYTWRTPVQSCATSREACFKNDAVYKALRYKNRDGVWNISRSHVFLSWHVLLSRQATISCHGSSCRDTSTRHDICPCMTYYHCMTCHPAWTGGHPMTRAFHTTRHPAM